VPESLLLHPDIARLARALSTRQPVRVEPDPPARRAAIAMVLRAGASGHPELLMIKRAEYAGDPWSGHIACPGGRMEPADHDLEQTAIRETWEETAIDITRDGRVLGVLDDLAPRTPVLPPLVIRPYVAVVRANVQVVASPEVADSFWVPMDALRARAQWGTGLVPIAGLGERQVEVFRHEQHVVWGITERILRQLVGLLEPGER
jgi:8-oxo-dGTP pyrophosphatase MutT (NUDIX family)